eukprot:CAMPEP_0194312646 /NCGR_PEP_ID=MMETSP0171-20130528/9577_1 /TAXON_ID=218684 /ORGANISM="Corethron pennatum, Strain L29A3" /LENGTH=35 /DNA_ID= /DNA_START= /DNA_END= /DNA_ORIENTATION=
MDGDPAQHLSRFELLHRNNLTYDLGFFAHTASDKD